VLDGKIGEYVVITRRHGSDWYVGAITDAARKLTVPLAFLGQGAFEATVYADTPESAQKPTAIGITPRKVSAGATGTLALDLAPGGGAAIVIRAAAASTPAPRK
jgi:alpha-glucosidase